MNMRDQDESVLVEHKELPGGVQNCRILHGKRSTMPSMCSGALVKKTAPKWTAFKISEQFSETKTDPTEGRRYSIFRSLNGRDSEEPGRLGEQPAKMRIGTRALVRVDVALAESLTNREGYFVG
jgi:hypothetical protein